MNFQVKLPQIFFGKGKLAEVVNICQGWGRKGFLVTGRQSAKRSGVLENLLSSLSLLGLEVTVFSVAPEPSVEDVDRAREEAKGSDFVIGMGGGSALDVAKATAGLINEVHPTSRFLFSEVEITQPPIPIIAIPTTAGTGSEVTQVSVLIGEKDGKRIKSSIHHPNLLPLYAILDPTLTLTCPASLTASAGADALSHCLEAFFSSASNPLSDAVALQGISLILRNFRRAVEKGDYESREAMLLGSLMGGIALSQAHLGAVHALAHSLGALKGVPHGIACGIFLPSLLRFNLPFIEEKLGLLARYLNIHPDGFIDEIESLLSSIGIPKNLREVGVSEEEAEEIVEGCKYSRSLRYNPRETSREDLLSIIRGLL
ncbi:MAG: iron-containing alcohol dehydrogenase family protein [bacterium]